MLLWSEYNYRHAFYSQEHLTTFMNFRVASW